MRKAIWVVPVLLLFAAIGAPNAYADSYTPTFTCTDTCVSLPTAPAVSFPSPTTIQETWDTLVFTLTLASPDAFGDTYMWENTYSISTAALASGIDISIIDETTGLTSSYSAGYGGLNPFPLGGTPITDTGVLTFSAVSTPEPGTSSLMLIGIGLLGSMVVMRKRIARGHQQAS